MANDATDDKTLESQREGSDTTQKPSADDVRDAVKEIGALTESEASKAKLRYEQSQGGKIPAGADWSDASKLVYGMLPLTIEDNGVNVLRTNGKVFDGSTTEITEDHQAVWRSGKARDESSGQHEPEDVVAAGAPVKSADVRNDDTLDGVAEAEPASASQSPEETVERERESLYWRANDKFGKPVDLGWKETPEMQRFKEDMDAFERRARESKMPPEEIAKTYAEISRLFDHESQYPTTTSERVMLAQQIMHLAAHPTEVDQGNYGTCNVATVESRLYTTNPSAVAKLVTDAAVSGQYTTNPPPPASPIKIRPNEQALHATGQSTHHPPSGDERCYASQIFQVTAVNIAWERSNEKNPPQCTRYEQREASPPGTTPSDGGDRLIDYSDPDHPEGKEIKKTNGNPKHGPDVYNDEIVNIAAEITGESQDGRFISRTSGHGIIRIESERELAEELAKAKKEGRLPVTIDVHTGKEPFATDGNKAGGSGGWHVINVTDYVEGYPPMLKVDNQWGEGVDHLGDGTGKGLLSVGDLYKAMSSFYEDLQAAKNELASRGRDTTAIELVMLRVEERDGDITHREYLSKLAAMRVQSELSWRMKQPPSSQDWDNRADAEDAFDSAMRRLPREERNLVNKVVQEVLPPVAEPAG